MCVCVIAKTISFLHARDTSRVLTAVLSRVALYDYVAQCSTSMILSASLTSRNSTLTAAQSLLDTPLRPQVIPRVAVWFLAWIDTDSVYDLCGVDAVQVVVWSRRR